MTQPRGDVLERLQNIDVDYLWRDAAEEIERLRAERAGDQQMLFHIEGAIAKEVAATIEQCVQVIKEAECPHGVINCSACRRGTERLIAAIRVINDRK